MHILVGFGKAQKFPKLVQALAIACPRGRCQRAGRKVSLNLCDMFRLDLLDGQVETAERETDSGGIQTARRRTVPALLKPETKIGAYTPIQCLVVRVGGHARLSRTRAMARLYSSRRNGFNKWTYRCVVRGLRCPNRFWNVVTGSLASAMRLPKA